mmetsp:Transcript_13992/g.12367  ORF Transcript_13992/g.12367 Transcript_13992/m.12367 type:complete len:170 (-) Transcript_13992:19-528(-)
MLKDHPNRDNIAYMVHPGVREHIFGISETTENWNKAYEEEYQYYFPNLDISLMKNEDGEIDELYYLKNIQPELKDQFDGKTKSQMEDIIKRSMKNRFPRSGVKPEGTRKRVKEVKEFIGSHLAKRPQEHHHKKVLVVTHSLTCKIWTEDLESMPQPYTGPPVNFVQVRN